MKKLLVLIVLLGASLMAVGKTVFDFTLNSIDLRKIQGPWFCDRRRSREQLRRSGTRHESGDQTFCTSKYHVTFPMMSKVSVKGGDIAPLYQFLTDRSQNPKTGGEIAWNFTKFLIGPDGKVLARFDSAVEPNSPEVTSAVEKALASLKS